MNLIWFVVFVPCFVVSVAVSIVFALIAARHVVSDRCERRRGVSDLESRVRTLERIVTDRRERLRNEIDRLA